MVAPLLFPVVHQSYQTGPIDEYVIQGNDALVKCSIPSFVSDFVSVVAWVDNAGNTILPASSGQIGKLRHAFA